MQELKFASENEALQYLANVTGQKIRVAVDSLVKVFMDREEMSKEEAEEYVEELRERVQDGENPEEVLYEEGLEPDYIFDLM